MFDTMLVDVMQFGDITMQKVRNDAVGFFMGDRELAHIHSYGRIDIPLPYEVGQNLIRLNVVEPHPNHDYGWYIHQMGTEKELQQGICCWLGTFFVDSYERRRPSSYRSRTEKLCLR